MKIRTLIIFSLLMFISYGQKKSCRTDILDKEVLAEKNEIEKYIKYDFSNLWLKTENELVYGVIGDEYQRILMKFMFVQRNLNNPNEYLVYGKSNVKSSICDFVGKITIITIQELKI